MLCRSWSGSKLLTKVISSQVTASNKNNNNKFFHYFLFAVEIPSFFPKTQPVLTFQSIYHENKGKPYYEMFQDYPYSPRWSGLEMAERTK